MKAEHIQVEQGSPEWFAARLGIPTASEFSTATAQKGPRGGEPKGRRTYMLKLLGERLTGEPQESYSNHHMERGKELEAEARELYAMVTGHAVEVCGFFRRNDIGASPDSMVGADGLLEIKTKLPHLHLDCILSDTVPAEHMDQIQGQLLVTGRKWVDFMSYWPGLPPFIKRVGPDVARQKFLMDELQVFLGELRALEARFRK